MSLRELLPAKKHLIPTVGGWCLIQTLALIIGARAFADTFKPETLAWYSMGITVPLGFILMAIRIGFPVRLVAITAGATLSIIAALTAQGTAQFLIALVPTAAFGGALSIMLFSHDQEELPLGSRTPMWGLKPEELEPSDTPITIKD